MLSIGEGLLFQLVQSFETSIGLCAWGWPKTDYSAKKNAKRLHGAVIAHDEQSRFSVRYPIQQNLTSKTRESMEPAAKKNKGKPKRPNRKGRSARKPNGDMTVAAPAAVGVVRRSTAIPQFSAGPSRAVVIRHRELIGDVPGSVNFSVGCTYNIQPGDLSAFPWLALIATNFETYAFPKLVYEFKSMKGTGVNGVVWMGVDIDSSDDPPADKQTISAYSGSVSSNVWVPQLRMNYPSGGMGKMPRKYIRPGALVSGTDIKTYDSGKIYVATQGCADASVIGELWVEYEVHLFVPQKNNLPEVYTQEFTSTSTSPNNSLLGATTVNDKSTISVDNTNSTITFGQPGRYLVECDWSGTGLTGAPGAASAVGCTVTNLTPNVSFISGTADTGTYTFIVNATNAAATLLLAFAGHLTTLASLRMRIARVFHDLV